MKKLVLFSLALALTGTVSAAEYETTLIDDDLNRHFDVEGWISSQSYEETEVTLRYNITLTHRYFNSTSIQNFEAVLADNGKELASDQTGNFKLKPNKSRTGFLEITSDRPPTRVNQLIFRTNHTGVATSGDERPSYAENDIDYSITSEYPEILSFKTNHSEAERGQNVTVTVHTDDIEHLKIERGNLTQLDNNTFHGKVKIPEKASTGEIDYTMETDNGNKFTEAINISVKNPSPELKASYSREIEGDETEIELEATDDVKVDQTYLIFQDQKYNTTDGNKVILPLQNLQDGNYNFTAVAVDNEDAETQETYSFNITSDPPSGTTDSSEQKDSEQSAQKDDSETDLEDQGEESNEEPASFPGVLIDPIIEFIKNMI